MTTESTQQDGRSRGLGAERFKAFIDAVVAIAMTLLILPLMESVSDVASGGEDTVHWFTEHVGQIASFVISFVIIAMFWIIHRRLFERVERMNGALQWLAVAWMLTIVWLPVATAISGQMASDDPLATAVYVGSMIATCLVSCSIRLYLRRHPELHDIDDRSIRSGVATDLAMTTLFAVALVVALLVPVIGSWALLLMLLASPLQGVYARLFGVRPKVGV